MACKSTSTALHPPVLAPPPSTKLIVFISFARSQSTTANMQPPGSSINTEDKQYFGEIKDELFLKNEARNLTFSTTSPIRLGDG